jgi:hypothetical protein
MMRFQTAKLMLVISIVSSVSFAIAQSTQIGSAHIDTFQSPDFVVHMLKSENMDIRRKMAISIGLKDSIEGNLCEDYDDDSISVDNISLIKGIESRLIIIKAQMCETMFLVPIIKNADTWAVMNPIRLSTHYTEPKYKVMNLIEDGEYEIVVTNQTVDWGTGINQRNMTIYKVIGNEVRVVFDAPESMHLAIPDNRVPITNNYQEDQKALFTFVNDSNGFSKLYIAEKRVESVGNKTYTVYRNYRWSPDLRQFRMVGSSQP